MTIPETGPTGKEPCPAGRRLSVLRSQLIQPCSAAAAAAPAGGKIRLGLVGALVARNTVFVFGCVLNFVFHCVLIEFGLCFALPCPCL